MSRVYTGYGESGKGKSTFATSGNGLCWYAEFDAGSFERTGRDEDDPKYEVHRYYSPLTSLLNEGVLSTEMAGREGKGAVIVKHHLEGWREVYWTFIKDYVEAVKRPDVSYIVLDTSTKLFTMAQNALRQRIQDEVASADQADRLKRLEYQEPQSQLGQMIEGAKIAGKDLVLVAHETAERWVENKPVGHKARGWDGAEEEADAVLRFTLLDNRPVAEITKAGKGGLDLIGLNIKEPDIETVNDVLDAAAKLRKAGKAVPRDAMEIIVEGAKL